MEEVEHIPDSDAIHRLVDFPRMFSGDAVNLDIVFEFSSSTKRESLVWSKYAQTPESVHAIGRVRVSQKKAARPDYSYAGFISSNAGVIRSIKIRSGHGFVVEHVPHNDQGRHHVEIGFLAANGLTPTKSERNELKIMLRRAFSTLVPTS